MLVPMIIMRSAVALIRMSFSVLSFVMEVGAGANMKVATELIEAGCL